MEDPFIPRNFPTRCLSGHVYFMRAEWAAMHGSFDSLGWYQRAARMAYDDATLNYNIALSYRRSGWHLAAEEMFDRAAKLDRKFAPQPSMASPAPALQGGQAPTVGPRQT